MSFAIELVGYGGFLPAAISIAIAFLARRYLPRGFAEPYAAALGFGVAFLVGYAVLPQWAPLLPKRHWHWLPYLGAIAALVGPLGTTRGASAIWRWLVQVALVALATWLLVPTWPSLQPPRTACILLLAGYFFLLTALVDRLPARLPGPMFLTLLSLAAVNVAVMAMAFVSETYGRVAGVAAAAAAGCCVAGWLHDNATTTRGLIPAFTFVVGGCAFVACIEPQAPLLGILLVPASPLALWVCTCGPLARLRGIAAGAAQSVATLLLLAFAWLVAWRG